MSKQHDRITRKLRDRRMAWAVRSDKYCSPNDPFEDQIGGIRTYHIHPDSSYPHQNLIRRFSRLRAIEEWLRYGDEDY